MADEKTTSGGIHISGGTVNNGGDMVGGNKIVHGSEIHGDYVGGDKFGDNSVKIGTMSGGTVQAGQGNTLVLTPVDAQELAKLIQAMSKKIDEMPPNPDVPKSEIKETVDKIDKEAQKGDQANTNMLDRWAKYLNEIAPDVVEVAATTFINPVAGVTLALQKIIKKAQGAQGSPATSG